MRKLYDVIKQLLEVIPEKEEQLRYELEFYLSTLREEETIDQWNDVGDILYGYIFYNFYPEITWQAQVERIWTGDEDPDNLNYTNF